MQTPTFRGGVREKVFNAECIGFIKIIKICKFTVFSSGFFCQIYRVTDEALIAETMVWPNFFLINVFFALKGSKLFIIIFYHCSWMLCSVAAVKSLSISRYRVDHFLIITSGVVGG